MLLEHEGRILVLDCGVLFPTDDQPGVDLVLPDFSPLRGRLDQVEAIVLTHGHEDHIGALPFLLRERSDIPLVGSRLTLALIEAKLREHRIPPARHPVQEGDRRRFGPFDCEFLAVNHSIPDALAVAVRTGAGTVLATGDFKMDPLPLDDRVTDLPGFARLGDEGVDLFLVDSTNAEVPGFTTYERDIAPVLDRVFARATGRVVVASFASHVHRVQQVLDAAATHGRKVGLVGRSMVRNMQIAGDLGYLDVPPDTLVDLNRLNSLPRHRVVLMSTGSQGEPMAALSRMANRSHQQITVEHGDVVVLASSLIPGNEHAVSRVINGLTRLGAQVVHKGNAMVHVSGHAAAGELLHVYRLVRPRNVLPVHGEPRHLRANAELAVAAGVSRSHVVVAENGVVVDLVDGRVQVAGAVRCGYVYVDGSTVGDVVEASLQDRLVLGEEGFVSVIVVMDSTTGTIAGGPEFQLRGLSEDPQIVEALRPLVVAAVEDATRDGLDDLHQIRQAIRRAVGRYVGKQLRRRPMIIPVVVEV